MGDLVYSYNSYYSGSNHLIEYRLDNDGEVLESIETPIDVQIGADFQQETIHLYRSGCYYAGSKLVILALVNKPCYLRQYIDGVETGNWTNMGSYTNNEGDYTFSGNFRISGQYYPGTESVDFYEGTTNVTINSKIAQKTTLSDYYDWVTNSAPLGGTVVVDYQFPAGGTYEYAKIVFKKDRIPADVNDGYAVDIDPTATSVEVEGISKTLGTKYYFAIFTDKSVSDEFVYEVTAPVPRFSIAKQFKSDNGTFNYNIPSWMEEKILQVLENNPSETSIWFDVENYPAVEGLYSHQFVEYPLQFRTYYGTYPETGSRPSTSYYIAKDFKLEWLWVSGNLSRDNTDYYKSNGEWVSGYTSGAGSFGRADSNFESSVALMFILDNRTKKGYPTFIIWAHSERWSGRKYQCNISKMGTNAQYDNVASAIYNALK